jgi:ankyrin repeat protein
MNTKNTTGIERRIAGWAANGPGTESLTIVGRPRSLAAWRVFTSVTLGVVLIAAGAHAENVAVDTRLVEAAKRGNTSTPLALLQQKLDPNATEPDGTAPLHWAVRNNDLVLMDRLLSAGADASTANRYGVTPMSLACRNGSADAVTRLLDAGVTPNITGEYGETALMTCARTGTVPAAQVLIDAGASVDAIESWHGQTALMWAADAGHADMVRALAAAGADVNARSTIVVWERQRTQEPRDKWLPPGGVTPLLLAAREGRLEAANALLDLGADINIVDPDQHTALILALINGHVDVAASLIERGADINMADRVGRTPLWAAVDLHTVPASNRPPPREFDDERSSLEVIEMLLARGAHVDAALRQQIPYRTKLDRGGDGVLGAGTTPLLRAAKAADTEVIERLLMHGADPKATTRNGVSGIMMAGNVAAREEDMTGRNKSQEDIARTIGVLLAAGADINAADTQGRTAAHGAALWGFTDVIRFLHKSGADLNQKDKRGFTALDTALGRAGGFGFDGRASVVQQETADAILELLGPGAVTASAAPSGQSPPPAGILDDLDDPGL